jgi:predicted metal-binding membrane protein
MTAPGPAQAVAGTRPQRAVVAMLLCASALAWWSSASRMRGMDNGPWTALGTFGWFVGVWVVMMAAMMVPSAIPTVTLYARLRQSRSLVLPLIFATGYLAVWGATGVAAYGAARIGADVARGAFEWGRAGRWIAGATVLAAAVYQLTPLKDACLGRCRNPLTFLLGSWRPGAVGALRMGAANGLWCVGCCWALMASLFALGIMSVAWMMVVAALVAIEKILPWRHIATWGTTATLVAIGVLLLAAPGLIPWLTEPGAPMRMGG